jgi:hypothetical protein
MIKEFDFFSTIELADVTDTTLVLLDIDNNMITHKQFILRDGNFSHRDRFFDIIKKVYGNEKVDDLWRRSSIQLLDKSFIEFFDKYKKNCVGLTARRTGKPSETSEDNIEEKIYYELKDLGVIFDPKVVENKYVKFSVDTDSKIVSDIKDFYIMNGPMFKNGIVFTCNYNKGHVLDEFVKIIGHMPDKIYAFDDKRKNLEDIMKYCEQIKVPFVGYHNLHYLKYFSNEKLPDYIEKIFSSTDHTKDDADLLIKYFEE